MPTKDAVIFRDCPYCREPIRFDALKCRCCGSSVSPDESCIPYVKKDEDGKPDHITYVIDTDLIRFAKVAAAALSLIIVAGASLTGLDLKKADSDARGAAEEARTSSIEIKKLKEEIAGSEKEVRENQRSLNADLQHVHELISDIELNKEFSDHLVAPFRTAQTSPSDDSSKIKNASYTPREIANFYNFPKNLDGAGQTIAIIELRGGYRDVDIKAYFSSLGLPAPRLSYVSVLGAKNDPSTAYSADGQVMLDIETVGAIAPKASIVVYFSKNTDQGFISAIQAVTGDKKNAPGVMLICWGSPEPRWTSQSRKMLNDSLEDAAIHGITTIAPTGDSGVTDGTDGPAVDFPASSPWVLAVGGTTLRSKEGRVSSEIVWNELRGGMGATGGGVSDSFSQPAWQAAAHITPFFGKAGRGIPDVSANANPSTGYIIRVDGQTSVIGGTSAAAPVWAGLIALINQGVGRNVGYVNPILYRSIGPGGAFNDITQGTNSDDGKGCKAGQGWDYCTGWGTPNGTKLLEAFRLTSSK